MCIFYIVLLPPFLPAVLCTLRTAIRKDEGISIVLLAWRWRNPPTLTQHLTIQSSLFPFLLLNSLYFPSHSHTFLQDKTREREREEEGAKKKNRWGSWSWYLLYTYVTFNIVIDSEKSRREEIAAEIFNWLRTIFIITILGTYLLITKFYNIPRGNKCYDAAKSWEERKGKGRTTEFCFTHHLCSLHDF